MASTYNGSVANLVDPLANSPLNSPSHAGQHTEINDALQTLGVWTSFTPAWASITVGNGTNVGAYVVFNKTMFLKTKFTMGSTSAMGSLPTLTIPGGFTLATANSLAFGVVGVDDIAPTYTTFVSHIYVLSSTTIRPYATLANTTYTNLTNISATVPMTWATGDMLSLDCVLELA